MGSSLITKKRIAKSLKQLMKQKEFEHISITEIMKYAQMRRQSFYTYFIDNDDLLEWIFETELKEQVSDNLAYISSEQLIEQLCFFFSDNHYFYKKLFALDRQNRFRQYFDSYCETVIDKYLTDHASFAIDDTKKEIFKHYHATAISGIFHQILREKTTDRTALKVLAKTVTTLLAGSLFAIKK